MAGKKDEGTRHILISAELHSRYKAACAREARAMQEVTEELVLRWVEKQEKKAGRQ